MRTIELVERILHPKTNQLIGYLVATVYKDVIFVGYSVRKPTDPLAFDREWGKQMARDRAVVLADRLIKAEDRQFPYVVQKKLPAFLVRCKKFFKNAELVPWAADLAQKLHV